MLLDTDTTCYCDHSGHSREIKVALVASRICANSVAMSVKLDNYIGKYGLTSHDFGNAHSRVSSDSFR